MRACFLAAAASSRAFFARASSPSRASSILPLHGSQHEAVQLCSAANVMALAGIDKLDPGISSLWVSEGSAVAFFSSVPAELAKKSKIVMSSDHIIMTPVLENKH